jgi:hypothetical protein
MTAAACGDCVPHQCVSVRSPRSMSAIALTKRFSRRYIPGLLDDSTCVTRGLRSFRFCIRAPLADVFQYQITTATKYPAFLDGLGEAARRDDFVSTVHDFSTIPPRTCRFAELQASHHLQTPPSPAIDNKGEFCQSDASSYVYVRIPRIDICGNHR